MTVSEADGYNADILAEQKQKLRELFPEVFSEDKIDWSKLKTTLGEGADIGERYGLGWKGKTEAFRLVQEKTVNTLHPAKSESVDWNTTQNLFIEGDNLEALKVLHKSYYGKVKMIYIDPPYNTGNDFVYDDDFHQTTAEYDDEDANSTRMDGLRKNTKDKGRYHSNWLNMMYPRLFLAKNLLRDDGVIFVSIDDNEIYNLRLMMNEIFGEENFIAQLIWKSRQIVDSRSNNGISTDHEYILVFSRKPDMRLRGKAISLEKYSNPDDDPRGPWMSNSILGLANSSQRPNLHYPLVDPSTGELYHPPEDSGWRYSQETMKQKVAENRIIFPKKLTGRPREKKYLNELSSNFTGLSSILTESVGYTLNGTREVRQLFGASYFDFPKPKDLLRFLVGQGTEQNNKDIVMDFFSGSGTLGHAVNELNAEDGGDRKWICVQLPELTDELSEAYKANYKNIADISKERIRRASKKISENLADKTIQGDLGFRVYKLGNSNFKRWNELVSNTEEMRQQMLDHLDPLEPNTTDEDLLTEILLKRGISPVTKIESRSDFYYIPSESLVISLSRVMTQEIFDEVLGESPSRIIILDHSFKDNLNLKSNVILQAEQKGVSIEVL